MFLLSLLGAAAVVGFALRGASRFAQGTAWVALLGLGSMASTGAFADYVPLTCVWLLSLLIARAVDSPRLAVALGACAVLQFFLLGAVPIGNWQPFQLMMPMSAVGMVAMMAVFAWTLLEARRSA